MTTPVPGFTYPSPRTWAAGDIHTASRWRDMTTLGYLFAGKCRPMLLSVNTTAQALSNGSNTALNIGANVPLNTWNATVQNTNTPSNVTAYPIPFGGWYLLQGDVTLTLAGTPANFKYGMGFQNVINGGASTRDGGSAPAVNSTSFLCGMAGCELAQFNPFTNDSAAMYAFTNNSSPGANHNSEFMIEWVGLPTSGLTSYTQFGGVYGTVVPSPQLVAAPPSGQGTTLTRTILAGATALTVADPTGIVTGSFIGLEYLNGQLVSSADPVTGAVTQRSEPVVVTAVSGANISIGACAYNHPAGAPVAVPLSAPFMNQQLRDIVNFLSYPPMLRAETTTTQSLASQAFPAGTAITNLAATLDNFSGFAGNTYTVPVAGVYFVYGQVYLAGSTSAFDAAAGISQNGGIKWGTRFRSTSTSARTVCPTVRRHLRLNAGDTIQLVASQDVGAGMNTVASGSAFSRLIAVWRSV